MNQMNARRTTRLGVGDDVMTIILTEQQWDEVRSAAELPARVVDPARSATFVLITSEVYERIKSLFEEVPVAPEERLYQLQQFGRRAGWDDPEMDIYGDLDPRQPL